MAARDVEMALAAPTRSDESRVLLPAILGSISAASLRDDLLNARGRPLTVDAADVSQSGALCLQVLVAARKTWAADGLAFRIVNAPEALEANLALFGEAWPAEREMSDDD